jgi:hypothetical protein
MRRAFAHPHPAFRPKGAAGVLRFRFSTPFFGPPSIPSFDALEVPPSIFANVAPVTLGPR